MIRPSKRRPVGFIVKPGRSVGDFSLGSKISDTFNYIRTNGEIFNAVEFKYNETDPLSMAYVIDLRTSGLELRFDPKTQRLCLIKVYDLERLELAYGTEDRLVSAPKSIPSLQMIYDRFGPTYAGRYSADGSEYVLEYPGLAFTFPIRKELLPENTESEMPKSLDVRLKTIHVWKEDDKQHDDDCIVFVNVGEGITVTRALQSAQVSSRSSAEPPTSTSSLDFTSTVEDVTLALGDPDEIFNKVDDPLSIHKVAEDVKSADYFYNYFRYGFDILFDGRAHTVKKFVLWTNMPSQPLFTKYEKCNYIIAPPPWAARNRSRSRAGSQQLEASISVFKPSSSSNAASHLRKYEEKDNLLNFDQDVDAPVDPVPLDVANNADPSNDDRPAPGSHESDDDFEEESAKASVKPDQRWNDIEELFGPPVGKPFVSPGAENSPFGGRLFKAFKDVIFEVMENGYVSKVILFKASSSQ